MLGGWEILLLLAVVLLLFGAKRLPELAKGLGKSIKEFKKASDGTEEIEVKPAAKPVETTKTESTKTHGSN
ncbi:MAG TPA: twin-arginine translocase TatA/TatE family subunit [Rariglobus sp.]|nr:twin-arginine translocase TatA/TatE family subunit [Rariglobus sp.]